MKLPLGDRDEQLLDRLQCGLWQGLEASSRVPVRRILAALLANVPSQASRRLAARVLARAEGGVARSLRWRQLLRKREGVLVGAWSDGPGLQIGVLPPNLVIGRYCSIGAGISLTNENHPLDRLTTSGQFFDPVHGLVPQRMLPPRPLLVVGHDVWIGANVNVVPGCRRIGHGAVVGAGSVVTRDVPPLAIVAGNPARVLRQRLEGEVAERWLRSAWWRHAPTELCRFGAATGGLAAMLAAIEACPAVWEASAVAADEEFTALAIGSADRAAR